MPTDTESPLLAPTRTYSLIEAAEVLCGATDPAALRWMTERLRGTAEPRLSGYKVQRRWRMTQEDLDSAIELLRPRRSALPETPALSSMTAGSRRRLLATVATKNGPRTAATGEGRRHPSH